MLAAFLASLALALAAPAPAEPVCNGQPAPPTDATEPTVLVCNKTIAYEIAADGRSIVLHWTTGGGATLERIELAEHADRVEVGVVERVPNGPRTLEARSAEHRVALGARLGDRAVVDAATGGRVLQRGPSPGEPRCPRVRKPSALEEHIALRKASGLPHGRAFARRMLRRKVPFTKAERRYVAIRSVLEFDAPVDSYLGRHRDEYWRLHDRRPLPRKALPTDPLHAPAAIPPGEPRAARDVPGPAARDPIRAVLRRSRQPRIPDRLGRGRR